MLTGVGSMSSLKHNPSKSPELQNILLTNEKMMLHNGPNGSFETPLRLGSKYTSCSCSRNYKSYSDVIRKVHSEQYLNELRSRCEQIGKIKWGCTICSFVNDSSLNSCEICGSNKPNDNWEYLGMIDGDTTYINQHSLQSVFAAVTCACDLSTGIVKGKIPFGFALVRPPGHHASKDTGKGFCLVNNTAIAAEAALDAGASRVFIFDWDLHHGDGIQEHFYHRNDVFYCSMHADGIYPHTGKFNEIGTDNGTGYTLNIPLIKGTTNENYLSKFREYVVPAIKSFNPDIILIAAGFDGLSTDPINMFALTPSIYGQIILDIKSINSRIGLILEGGYDPEGIQTSVDICINALSH